MLFVASVKPSLENHERRAREAERVPIPFQQAVVADQVASVLHA
jgi:hypothetical protein